MAPRRQVEDLPGLNATSNPATSLQGAIAFAPRDNPLLDLAQSLKGINRQLGSYFDKQIEQQNEAAIAEGKRLAMLDDAKSYKQYVEKGGEPMASPWVQYGYKQQKGRVLGQSYSAFISDKRLNWEGAGSDDIDGQAIVNEMPKWRQEFLQAQGDLDPVEMTGFDAYAITEEDNTVRSHIANEREQSMKNYETQVYNEFYNLLSDPKLNQQQLHAKIEEVYQRQEFQGLRNMVAPLLLQATTDLAKSGDVNAVEKVREFTRKDAKTGQVIPIMKNTKAKAVLDDAEAAAKRASVQADNVARARSDEERRARADEVDRNIVERTVKERKPLDPLMAAEEAIKVGADPVQAMRTQATMNNALENSQSDATEALRDRVILDLMNSTVPTSERKLAEYTSQIVAAGGGPEDVEAVRKVWQEYQASGKSLYSQYPELGGLVSQAVAQSSAANSLDGGAMSKDEANMLMAKAVRQAVVAKTPPDKFVDRVSKLFGMETARREAALKKARESFTEGATMNSDGTPATQKTKPQPATPKPQASTRSTTGVATAAEIRGLITRSRQDQDAFLGSKPVLPASLMMGAYMDAVKKQPSENLTMALEAAKSVGIDTRDQVKALNELMDRGQGKFYPGITAARARTAPKQRQ